MFARALDMFRGKAITIPPMDGALRPNTALDDARSLLDVVRPDNLAWIEDRLVFSCDNKIMALNQAGGTASAEVMAEFPAAVTCLAARIGGGSAIGLDNGQIMAWDAEGTAVTIEDVGPAKLKCPTALLFLDKNTLVVCQGSAHAAPSHWARDLMEQGASGSLWRIDLATGRQTCLGAGLAFPFGLLSDATGSSLIVAESWKHRLIKLSAEGLTTPKPILANLPGYPCRLSPAGDGGAWLCLFAPRNRLIEFILQEDDYRRGMIGEIEPEFWIAPALSSHRSFLEPLQCGGVKTMGINKPWAPSRSYGLLVHLDKDLQPTASFHSRANGTRHGLTSAIQMGNRVMVASKGGDAILALDAGLPAEG
jgi:hypothetical protein